ncbi:MAG: hypothetical protein FGM46_00100 [Ferruginibacter sp.]|nr:hypothetical protein [Ferruginibacter sp.]
MKTAINILLLSVFFLLTSHLASAQCAMCTKTASQLGEKPALGLNNGILYLMLAPFAVMGYIGYRWWKGRVTEEGKNDE